MKRIVLALFALALLAPVALSRTGGDDAAAQTSGSAPEFVHESQSYAEPPLIYLLDAGSDGSSTAIAVGTPAFTAGTITGGTDACTLDRENVRATDTFGVTGAASSVFTVGSDCAITYTGAATASTITATRVGWALFLSVSDGVDASGDPDTSIDDDVYVFVKLVDATTDLAALKGLYDGTGGASWTARANWRFRPAESFTFTGTAGTASNRVGYLSGGAGSSTISPGTFSLGGTTYTVHFIAWQTGTFSNIMRFSVSPNSGAANFAGFTMRIGSASSNLPTNPPAANIGGSTAYNFILDGINANPMTSGSAYSATLSRAADALAASWTGVTLTSGRLTALALDNNNLAGSLSDRFTTARGGTIAPMVSLNKLTSLDLGNNAGLTGAIPGALGHLTALTSLDLGVDANDGGLTGAIPAGLGRLTALTTLNLSGHAGLTGRIPGALTNITGLTTLDLSDTGVCVDPATETAIETWLNAIRGRSGGMALVDTCGSPRGPSFGRAEVTPGLQSGADGSSTAIPLGSFFFRPSTYSNPGEVCAIATAIDNPSNDPDDFLATGTARTGFTATVNADGDACDLAYTGSGVPGTVAAVSIRIGVSDQVDPTGAAADNHDSLVQVTVKVRGIGTDEDALHHLHDNAGGASWTTRTGWWDVPVIHIFELTVGTAANLARGYGSSVVFSSAPGAVRNSSNTVTLGSNTYTVIGLYESLSSGDSGETFVISTGAPARATSDWDGLRLRIGGVMATEDRVQEALSRIYARFPITSGTIPASGDFNAELIGTGAQALGRLHPASAWHGVTLTNGRVTGLDLSNNNLTGAAATALAELDELDQLTSLDLSSPPDADLPMGTSRTPNAFTGAIPAGLGTLTALTSLDLSGAGFSGAITAALWNLTSLTSLDLSDNAGLTASRTVLDALATGLTSLTNLDLSGTGICVNPADPGQADIVTWIGNIRGSNTNTGVAKVPTCGSPAAPAFGAAAVTYDLQSGADGSTTAIAVGSPSFTTGDPFVGGDTITCAIATAIDNPSNVPADFLTTGTARTGFTVAVNDDGNACDVAYEGSGVPATVVAVSLAVTVSDGVDPEAGTLGGGADATINVTVKVRGIGTDRDALNAFHAVSGGAGWTESGGWTGERVLQTFELTSGSSGTAVGYDSSTGLGSVRNDSSAVVVGGTTFTLQALSARTDSNTVSFFVSPKAAATTAFTGLTLRRGTTDLEIDSGTAVTIVTQWHGWTWTQAGFIPGSGNFEASLVDENPATGTWHGVTVTGGRVTGLDLSNNNLRGAAGTALAELGELDLLATLDLSSPAQADLPMGTLRTANALTGAIPAGLGDITTLTTLDLSGNALSDSIPVELGMLTSLTSLDLSDNNLSGALPSELGDLTALESLDLSGNAGLTVGDTVLGTLAANLTSLTNLDLSGTGICVDPGDPDHAAAVTWIGDIRGSTGGVAKVDTCGNPAAPVFRDAAVTLGLQSAADGSTTAIAIGSPAFTAGTFVGGGTMTCAIATAIDNSSNDPANFLRTGTARTGFSVAVNDDGNACVLTYGGSGVPATLAAVSIAVTVSDGVDPAAGTLSDGADSTILVTVKVRGLTTDRAALKHLYDNAGGASWTSSANWDFPATVVVGYPLIHTFELTAAERTSSGDTYRGYGAGSSGQGALRNNSAGPFTLGGVSYTLDALEQFDGGTGTPVVLILGTSGTRDVNHLSGLRLRIGTTVAVATGLTTVSWVTGGIGADFRMTWGTVPSSGDFDAQLLGATAAGPAANWHGATVAGGRLTGLDLSNNNLRGAASTALAELGELDQLTALDLSSPAAADLPSGTARTPNAFTGAIPADIGTLIRLTSLDLSGAGFTGAIPAGLADLTSLTTLDLSGNAGLTASATVLGALAANLTSLTTLDLSGTGICVDPSDPDQADVVTWIGNIRMGAGGVARVRTCGSPAAPAFSAAAVTYGLQSMADGSTTAIAVGSAAFTAGTYVGGDATTCAIATAIDNTSNDPANFLTTGTARMGFTATVNAAGNACDIAYEQTGVPATLAAVSLAVTVSDGIDPAAGTIEAMATADATIRVTVKVRGLGTDGIALHHLYNNAGGGSWTTRTGWWDNTAMALATLTTSSTWHGVTLASGRVTGLALPGNNLRGDAGTALAELDELGGLTSLDLSGNTGLTGAIPAEVGALTALTSLDLSGAGFTGAIPAVLGDLTALTALDLSGNALGDAIPTELGALTALTSLDLSGNALRDALPSEMEDLTALTSLDLSGNAGLTASATVLGALATNLTSLTNLDLSGTGICVDPSDMDQAGIVTWIGNIRGRSGGVAKAPTCGSPAAPAFSAGAVTYGLQSGADGSTTAIAIGSPAFTAGTFAGGGTTTCAIATAIDNPSNDPADFLTTGTARPDFTVTLSGSTCVIEYEGTGVPASVAAVSLAVTVSDGIDPAAGTLADGADATIRVTVKVRGIGTDGDALHAFYDNAGGSGWTTRTGWWDATAMELATLTASSTWHGVTITGGRVTGLALPGNNLTGAAETALAELAELDGLTVLDLGSNGLSGNIPSELGSLTALVGLGLGNNPDVGGDLSHLTNLTALRAIGLWGTRLCVDPAEQPAVETWLNGLRGNGASVDVRTCGSPAAPRLADTAATYLLDAGANGSSTPVVVGTPSFTGGSYSGGAGNCTFTAIANPSASPASFLATGTAVTGFAVDSSNCAITWTGSSAPSRVVGTRVAVSIGLSVTDGVNERGQVSPVADDTMQVTVKLVDLATDRLGLEALYADANGAGWGTNTDWESATLSSSWHGVTVAGSRVTALALADNRLSGRLPALLGDLSRLTSLDLSGNGGLAGGIPVEFTRLRSLVRLDLSDTRVCARNIGGAVNAWLNAVRAKPGGEVRLGSCPAPAAPGGSAGITLREEGPDAPSGLRYALLLECGGTSVTISLGADERYPASVAGGAVCSLTVTDRQGASAVRGEFSGLSLAGDVTVTIVRGEADDGDGGRSGMAPAGPDPELERTLVTGMAFARWRGADATPVEDVVEELTLCVVAVYWWDARTQAWRAWFPGAEGLGVNTLRALREDGIYVFAAEDRTPDNCGLLPDDEDGEDGEDGG